MRAIEDAFEERKKVLEDLQVPEEFESRLRRALESNQAGKMKRKSRVVSLIVAAACMLLLAGGTFKVIEYFRGGTPDVVSSPEEDDLTPQDQDIKGDTEVSKDKGNETVEKPKDTLSNNPYGLMIGEEYTVKGVTGVYEYPSAYGVMGPKFSTFPGSPFVLEEIEDKFVLIRSADKRSNDLEGWVPWWYLTQGSSEVELTPPDEWIVASPTPFYLYPGEETPSGYEIEAGTVVHVIKEYQDWYCVDMMAYDSPHSGDKWIKKDALVEYDSALAREGSVKAGAILYDEKGNEIEALSSTMMCPVRITDGQRDGMYFVMGPGGWSGYIQKDDFVPNPYDYLRKAQAEYTANYIEIAQKVELINIAGKTVSTLQGDQLKTLAALVRKTHVGPYPEGYTGGEVKGILVVYYPGDEPFSGGKINISLAEGYLGLVSFASADSWLINEPYLLFEEKDLDKQIEFLFLGQGTESNSDIGQDEQ